MKQQLDLNCFVTFLYSTAKALRWTCWTGGAVLFPVFPPEEGSKLSHSMVAALVSAPNFLGAGVTKMTSMKAETSPSLPSLLVRRFDDPR